MAANLTNPDTRFVINVCSGVTLSDGTELTAEQTTWWVGGAQAGAKYNQSLTYATYPNAVAATPVMTNNQIISALNAGKLILAAEDGKVRVNRISTAW